MPRLVVVKQLAFVSFASQQLKLGPIPSAVHGAVSGLVSGSAGAGSALGSNAIRGAVSGAAGAAMGASSAVGGSPAGGPTAGGAAPSTATPLPSPPCLFKENSNSAADVQFQKDQHDYYSRLINDLLDAVVFAHGLWKLQAFFSDIRIMSLTAIGGKLNGPSLDSLISTAPTVAGYAGNEGRIRNAVAKGVADSFWRWQKGVTVPGLPWYPAFLAFPGPAAPPMPNIPTPLITCPSPNATEIMTPGPMKDHMKANLQGTFPFANELFQALATALAAAFTLWIPSQMIMLVMGKGPIPSFAPPYVPVGPVVAGEVIPTPGHLAM